MGTKKINILFLLPGPIYRPDLPDFKDKYVMLSENFKGTILTWTTDKKFRDYRIGNFIFKPLLRKDGGFLTNLLLVFFIISKAIIMNYKNQRFQIIICYDPLLTGMIGVILKYILSCKLIIELNGNLLNAGFLKQVSFAKRIRRILYKILIYFSLINADTIKIVNNSQKNFLINPLRKKRIICFPDFVPTHYFMEKKIHEEKYILFVGHPFYLKGVDILIRAFGQISDKYPEFFLKLIGYRLEDDAKGYFCNLNGKIQFLAPVFYDRIREEFLNCYCFVLPSREESMGRVLLEAMSCAKPVIGANVGGIPEVIKVGENGFLFKKENSQDLASKLDILLANPKLAKRMGERGRELVKERFSSEKYCELFKNMVYATLKN